MTKKQLKAKIAELKKELEAEMKANGLTKRAIFLDATIKVYTSRLAK